MSLLDEHGYRPLIIRVMEILRERADADGRVQISNRELGRLLDCSIANIPSIRRRLESAGLVVCEGTEPGGTWYHLLAPALAPDASPPPGARQLLLEGRKRPGPVRTLRKSSARSSRQSQTTRGAPSDVVAQLERLAQLKERGALTDEEFQAAKRQILDLSREPG